MVYYFLLSASRWDTFFGFKVAVLDLFQVANGASSSMGQHLDTPYTFLLNYKGNLGFVSPNTSGNIYEFDKWVL